MGCPSNHAISTAIYPPDQLIHALWIDERATAHRVFHRDLILRNSDYLEADLDICVKLCDTSLHLYTPTFGNDRESFR
jgi:hypothetical protein